MLYVIAVSSIVVIAMRRVITIYIYIYIKEGQHLRSQYCTIASLVSINNTYYHHTVVEDKYIASEFTIFPLIL